MLRGLFFWLSLATMLGGVALAVTSLRLLREDRLLDTKGIEITATITNRQHVPQACDVRNSRRSCSQPYDIFTYRFNVGDRQYGGEHRIENATENTLSNGELPIIYLPNDPSVHHSPTATKAGESTTALLLSLFLIVFGAGFFFRNDGVARLRHILRI